MNKRVAAAAAGILLLATLTSCNRNNGNDTTTTMPDLTGATQSTSGYVQQTESATGLNTPAANTAPTYILTTQQGQTMLTVPLTAFSIETTGSTSIEIPSNFTNPTMDTPEVNTSAMTTLPAPVTTTAPSTTRAPESTTESTTQPPTVPEAERVRQEVDVSANGPDSNGNYVISFETEGWDGGVKSKSDALITVDVDGKAYNFVKAKVNGTPDVDGYATITVYLNDRDIGEDSNITCHFPAGFITSKNGNQTSVDFSVSGKYSP